MELNILQIIRGHFDIWFIFLYWFLVYCSYDCSFNICSAVKQVSAEVDLFALGKLLYAFL